MSTARGDVGSSSVDEGSNLWKPAAEPGLRHRWWVFVGFAVAVATVLGAGELAVAPVQDRQELAIERGGEAVLPAAPGSGLHAAADWRPPAPGTWAVLPPAPIGWRSGHVVVTLGDHVVVWGGWQQGRPLRNGALLDVTSGEWTQLPESPASQRRHVPVVAGRTLLLLDEARPQAYSLDEARWSELERPPLPTGSRLTGVTAWTGRMAVIATARAGDLAGPLLAWHVEDGTWSMLPAPPGRVDDDMAMVVDGRGLLLLGEGGSGFVRRLRLEPGRTRAASGWEDVAPPDLPPGELASAGVRAVSAGTLRHDPVYVWLAPRADGPTSDARLLAYRGAQTDRGVWSRLPDPPQALIDPELVVAGEDLVALDASGVVRYRPGSPLARDLPLPQIAPLQQRDATAIRDAVVWWGGGAGDGAVWRSPGSAGSTRR